MNQNEGYELARALAAAFREAAKRHDEATKLREALGPAQRADGGGLHAPPMPRQPTPEERALHKELARDYRAFADAIGL